MITNIEIFYTCGGITLAETDLNETEYAVVSSDSPNFLTIYNRDDDNEKSYLPDDMIVSTPKEKLTSNLKPLYTEMVKKLTLEA